MLPPSTRPGSSTIPSWTSWILSAKVCSHPILFDGAEEALDNEYAPFVFDEEFILITLTRHFAENAF